MSIQKGRANYTAVSLPQELLNQVDECIKKDPIFRSRAEFVKEAIKEKLLNVYSGFPDTVLIKEHKKGSNWESIPKHKFYTGITQKELDNIDVIHFPELLQKILTDLERIEKNTKKLDDFIANQEIKNYVNDIINMILNIDKTVKKTIDEKTDTMLKELKKKK